VSRPRLLVLSFSRIDADARVLKQVRRLKEHFDLVTCGYGDAPDPDVPHLRVPDDAVNRLDGRLITLRAYRAAYATQSAVRWVLAHVPRGSADLVLANDLDAVPVALWLRPRLGVHADLHEFFPLLHEHDQAWMRRIAPYQDWLCRTYLPRAGAVTTVSQGLAREYSRRYGIEVGVVRNATPYADLTPTPAGPEGLRLVHSGACLRHRRLHLMIEAVGLLGSGVPFDLYLTPNDPAYLAELRELAAGVPGVTVRDPVPYAELVPTLNRYQVGVFLLPPTTFSYTWALPNKVFDFVQARLATVVGPSPEMAELVRSRHLGVVAEDFTPQALADALAGLDPSAVAGYQASAHAQALELSDAAESAKWLDALGGIAGLPGVVDR
jgi:hypothetical protein